VQKGENVVSGIIQSLSFLKSFLETFTLPDVVAGVHIRMNDVHSENLSPRSQFQPRGENRLRTLYMGVSC
jgi:hypothetical protein